jgi:hypothetical protein
VKKKGKRERDNSDLWGKREREREREEVGRERENEKKIGSKRERERASSFPHFFPPSFFDDTHSPFSSFPRASAPPFDPITMLVLASSNVARAAAPKSVGNKVRKSAGERWKKRQLRSN